MLSWQRILRLLAVAVFALLAASTTVLAESQGPVDDVDNTLIGRDTNGAQASAPEISVKTSTGGASPQAMMLTTPLLDDFNRPDGPLGPNWTERASVFRIVLQAARGGTPSNLRAIATYNGGYGNVVEGDVRANSQFLDYTGFVLDYGAGVSNLFIKVQDNEGIGAFTHGACYLGNNGLGGTFGLGFFHLSARFVSAHMKVTVDAARTVTIEFSNIDGGPGTQTYVCTGAPSPEGTGVGIVGYQGTSASMDNFRAQAQPTGAQIVGWVFVDANGNGWREVEETAGLNRVALTLERGGQVVGRTRSVGSDGWYDFDPVDPGDYCVTASIPADYAATSPTRVCFQLAGGQNQVVTFGVQRLPPATVGDYVWYDANANGLPDVGEPGLGNVTVALYRDNGDGVFDRQADALTATAVTDADGGYLIRGVPAGTYFVVLSDPLGVLAGLTPTVGPQAQPQPFGPLVLAAGQLYQAADFGFTRRLAAGLGVIGDRVWYDGDGDGRPDPGEPGIAGVRVCATALSYLNPMICATTDVNGSYRLRVPAGAYLVAVVQPPVGLVPSPLAFRLPLVVMAGGHYLEIDFGYAAEATLLGRISGQLWLDAVADGNYAPATEVGLAGVSVSLMRDLDGDGAWGPGEPIAATTTSDPGGGFVFTGVPAGDYLVLATDTHNVLAGYGPTVVGATTQNRPQPYALRLAPGATDTRANFGYVPVGGRGSLGVIGNQVWHETDGDGVFEPGEGEVGLAGVTVALYRDGGVVATAVTSASGQYAFTGLAAGSYSVQVSDTFGVLAGLIPTADGPQPGQDGQSQAQPYAVNLAADGRILSADFGYRPAPK